MHCLDHLGPLVIHELQQLRAQPRIALRGHVVFGARRDLRRGDVIVIAIVVRLAGKGLAHGAKHIRGHGEARTRLVLKL